MNITVVGTGYVGFANAVLLAQHNRVIAMDISQERVDLVNQGISPTTLLGPYKYDIHSSFSEAQRKTSSALYLKFLETF